jgi:hypothetical protein
MQKDYPGGGSHPRNAARREQDLDEREAALDARERRLELREAALADRGDRERELLAEADRRDDAAIARDAAATWRDIEESLADSPGSGAVAAREAAALERDDARSDRAAAKADRSMLTDTNPTWHGLCPVCGAPRTWQVTQRASGGWLGQVVCSREDEHADGTLRMALGEL